MPPTCLTGTPDVWVDPELGLPMPNVPLRTPLTRPFRPADVWVDPEAGLPLPNAPLRTPLTWPEIWPEVGIVPLL